MYLLRVPEPLAPPRTGWLTLQEASERLDAHPATVRQWADRGRIRTYRTPGGHRRFSAEDVRALVASSGPQAAPELDLLLTSALGRTRLEASAGRLSIEEWYGRLGGAAREQHRALGRQLLTLLVGYLQNGADLDSAVDQARAVGRSYGEAARLARLALPDAVRAFLLFRDLLVESVLQTRAVLGSGRSHHDLIATHRKVGPFLDEVLIALLDAYGPAGTGEREP
jgi:excisionase family DNA binding protein